MTRPAVTTYLTGLDGSGNRLFQVGFVNSGTVKQLGYFDSSGTWTLIGASGDLIGNNNTYWRFHLSHLQLDCFENSKKCYKS